MFLVKTRGGLSEAREPTIFMISDKKSMTLEIFDFYQVLGILIIRCFMSIRKEGTLGNGIGAWVKIKIYNANARRMEPSNLRCGRNEATEPIPHTPICLRRRVATLGPLVNN